MNMNIFKRTKSIVTKNPPRQQDSPTSSSSSRQPLVQQTNIDLQSSQSSLSSRDDHVSSSDPASYDSSPSKRLIGQKISHRDVDEPNKSKTSHSSASSSPEMPYSRGLAPAPRSPRSTKTNHSDMYTKNDLQTFSFGAAPSTSSALPLPVDPLTRPRDEADSDELSLVPDTTPRPSVVGSHHPRSHQSQPSGLEGWPPSFSPTRVKPPGTGGRAGGKSREQDSDAISTHTFGTSSASASVSSLSRPGGADSRANSRISGHSSTTPQTSANDLTSDEDEDMIGRHPLPPEPRDPSLPNRFLPPDQESSLYLSEEEFEVYEEYEPDIEIDSVANEASDCGTYFDYSNQSRDSFTMDQSERRGSLAMAIPSMPSDRSYLDHRAREYSTARRPSRSLEDLHSFSLPQGPGQYSSASRRAGDHPLPPAPTSVPESEGDWRDLRKRSIQRDKDLPPIMPVANSSSAGASSSNVNNTSSRGASATDGFDTSCFQEYGVNGVVGFDPSEMADIVGEGNLNGHRPSIYSFRKGSTASAARRQSTVSSNIDIMHKNILGPWSNQKYRDQRQMWQFVREKGRPDDDSNRPHNGGQERERERPSISTLFASRPSTSGGEHNNGPIPFFDKPEGKDKAAVVKSKEKPHKEPWKGMALDSEEFWFNGSSGKFRVNRRNANSVEAGKPPQQRLNITYIRSPFIFNATNRDPADGPAVTIHKHSKAAAFSISRHYRTRPSAGSSAAISPHDTNSSMRHTTSSIGQISSKDSGDGSRKKSNMILLGTRRVQRAYTSTNTTRKLESHGLLDDNGRTSPRDVDRMRRDDHERQRSRTKDKERKDKDKDKGKGKEKDKRKPAEASSSKRSTAKGESKSKDSKHKDSKSKDILLPAQALLDSSEGSSAGSVANALSSGDSGTLVNSSTAVTTPEPTEATNSAGSVGSIEQSILSQETTSSDRTVSRANFYRSPPRRHNVYDIDDVFDDDSSEDHPRYPARTPHRETYGALPAEVLESVHHEHPHTRLFGWGRPKGVDRTGSRSNPFEQSYNPPWPVTQPRSNSETRKGIVDDLNTSFQDVGLLPAIGEIRGSSTHSGQHKRKRDQHPKKHVKRPSDKTQTDIFEEVPDDALYMLLPLWPGETDPNSSRKYPYSPPPIPTNARQYLLIYWRAYVAPPPPVPQEGGSKSKSGEKKRSQESPVASEDNVNDRVVLLHSFHISGRVFAYRDLQGSGVRIPDVGLAVSGPLEDAYQSIPSTIPKDDYVIGICHSRESGIEFVPEGFEKMGLSKTIPNPRTAEPSEDDDSQSFDTIQVLNPIGRAVMEMAWLGSMAVTSFNPNL